jgi:hypothetical protein
MRDPTIDELYESAFGITDDVSWYVFRDDAVRQQGSSWEQGYEAWCIDNKGYVPIRLHNLGSPNQWNYPPGPACVQSLPALPPDLKQWQISYMNACVPYELIVGATAAINKLKEAITSKAHGSQS